MGKEQKTKEDINQENLEILLKLNGIRVQQSQKPLEYDEVHFVNPTDPKIGVRSEFIQENNAYALCAELDGSLHENPKIKQVILNLKDVKLMASEAWNGLINLVKDKKTSRIVLVNMNDDVYIRLNQLGVTGFFEVVDTKL